jgi:hypothetical protein
MAKHIELKIGLDAAAMLCRAIGMVDGVSVALDDPMREALVCAIEIFDEVLGAAMDRALEEVFGGQSGEEKGADNE